MHIFGPLLHGLNVQGFDTNNVSGVINDFDGINFKVPFLHTHTQRKKNTFWLNIGTGPRIRRRKFVYALRIWRCTSLRNWPNSTSCKGVLRWWDGLLLSFTCIRIPIIMIYNTSHDHRIFKRGIPIPTKTAYYRNMTQATSTNITSNQQSLVLISVFFLFFNEWHTIEISILTRIQHGRDEIYQTYILYILIITITD